MNAFTVVLTGRCNIKTGLVYKHCRLIKIIPFSELTNHKKSNLFVFLLSPDLIYYLFPCMTMLMSLTLFQVVIYDYSHIALYTADKPTYPRNS